jgi:TolB-like protein/AraC-like DNA-binding protein/Tfp pilus assembly protein PilF
MTGHQSADQNFIARLTEIVLANISREDFDVEELAREAQMSRSSIHRNLKRLTNKNASQFIREIRLKRALEMLQNDLYTASEVAYRVGFGSPAYFTRCFHEFFGYPPGKVKKRNIPEDADSLETVSAEMPARESSRPVKIKARKAFIIIAATVTLLLVLFFLKTSGSMNQSKEMSIVVLPFKNLSGNPDNQYFADGIMEDILNSLYQISDLRVVSRTTAEHFRDTNLTSGEISRILNARYVLECSVRRQDETVRVTVQLIDGRKEQHLWSENYDRKLINMLGIQSEVASQVAEKLNAVITEKEARQISELPTTDPAAYDYYLRARFLMNKANDVQRFDISRDGLMSSLKYYEMAIQADSAFADAYAGLANAWYNLSAWGWYKPYTEGISRAQENFTRALKLDPDCAEAHAIRGIWFAYPQRKFEEARAELQTALQLNPNYSAAHQWYAQLLMITGPIDEARIHVDRALELEPYFWVIHNLNSWICYFEERYQEGIDASLTAYDLNHDFLTNNWLFILHYVKLGEGEKALKALQQLFSRYPSISHYAAEVKGAFTKSGIDGIFTWLIDLNKNNPIPAEGLSGNPFYISWWYAITGNREESIYWLERAVNAEKTPMHYFNLIANNPDFDLLRDDPRFLAVIEKAGLAPYHKRKAR